MNNSSGMRNPAYILLLIRNGVVNDLDGLYRHFGLEPTPWPYYSCRTNEIDKALDALREVALVHFEHGENQRHLLKVTPLLGEIQASLQFSLVALASGQPHHRLIVSPRFETHDADSYRSDILVVMPFVPALKVLYEDHLKPVAQALQMTIARADDFFTGGQVMTEIWSAIVKAKVLIADCTGRNPNVFYEIGLAHALGKPVILITQTAEDVPFDLRQYRYVQYEFSPRGMKSFEDKLFRTLKSTLQDDDASRELRVF